MKKICAWCQKELDEQQDARRGPISHGICSLCALKLTENIQRSAQDILNILEEPVFIVGSDGVIRKTNTSGQKILGKGFADIEDELVGDAFECSYSKEPGGCGRTVHCAACTIRNIIIETLANGKSFERVPAFHVVKIDGIEIVRHYLMSTERQGDFLLLRIDDLVSEESAGVG